MCPIHNLKGVFFVVLEGQLFIIYWTIGNHPAQSSCWWLQNVRNRTSIVWLVHSDCPSVWGWYAVLRFWLIPKLAQSSLNNLNVKHVSLSDMTLQGILVYGKTFSFSNSAISMLPILSLCYGLDLWRGLWHISFSYPPFSLWHVYDRQLSQHNDWWRTRLAYWYDDWLAYWYDDSPLVIPVHLYYIKTAVQTKKGL